MLLLRPSGRLLPQLPSLHGRALLCSPPKHPGEREWLNRYSVPFQGCEHCASALCLGLSSLCPGSCLKPDEGCGVASEWCLGSA